MTRIRANEKAREKALQRREEHEAKKAEEVKAAPIKQVPTETKKAKP